MGNGACRKIEIYPGRWASLENGFKSLAAKNWSFRAALFAPNFLGFNLQFYGNSVLERFRNRQLALQIQFGQLLSNERKVPDQDQLFRTGSGRGQPPAIRTEAK